MECLIFTRREADAGLARMLTPMPYRMDASLLAQALDRYVREPRAINPSDKLWNALKQNLVVVFPNDRPAR